MLDRAVLYCIIYVGSCGFLLYGYMLDRAVLYCIIYVGSCGFLLYGICWIVRFCIVWIYVGSCGFLLYGYMLDRDCRLAGTVGTACIGAW